MASLLRRRSVQLSLAVLTATGGVAVARRTSNSSKRLTSTDINPPTILPDGTLQTDVLIVGSGGAALVAALRARDAGLSTLVVEKAPKIGGTSCYSGGTLWIPNNKIPGRGDDSGDTFESALEYMENIIAPDVGPASTRERKVAFLQNGPQMISWLSSLGYKWQASEGYPDYFPEVREGRRGGRSVESALFDMNIVGPWTTRLNANPVRPPVPLHAFEIKDFTRVRVSWYSRMQAFRVFAIRQYFPRYVFGEANVTLGHSMIAQLLYLNLKSGTTVLVDTPLRDLIVDKDGKVTGAIVTRDGKDVKVEASKGVILAAGGFARNAPMRRKYQHKDITSDWTVTTPTDTGDAVLAAMKIGAATSLMDSAWWGVCLIDPATGARTWEQANRMLPHSVIVDQTGRRYTNETDNYCTLGTNVWERQTENGKAIPSWMVIDSNHKDKYVIAYKLLPGLPSKAAQDSGFIVKGDTLEELAGKIGVPEGNLKETVDRFNGFAEKDVPVDEDFGRGTSYYSRWLGDPDYPNPNMGVVNKAPYYALKVHPADLGTKGGILTDEHGRALREKKGGKSGEYEPIPGLYAAGNSTATVMGRTYAGAGGTLGPAMTFAYIGVSHIISQSGAEKQS